MYILRASFLFIFSLLFISIYAGNDNLNKAKELFEAKKFREAKSLLESLIENNDKDHEAFYYLGRVNLGLNDYDEAEENFEEAIDLNGNVAEYHFWLAQAYGVDAMDSNVITQTILAPKIKNEYETTLKLDNKHIGARVGLANFYLIAPGIMGGDINKAYDQAHKIITLDEKRGRMILAGIYQKEKKVTKAEEEYKLLEKKYGDDAEFFGFYNTYGYFLLNQKRYEESIDKFKKQIQLVPKSVNAYDSLGDGYKAAGKNKEAIEAYEKAISLDPNFKPSKEKLAELKKKK